MARLDSPPVLGMSGRTVIGIGVGAIGFGRKVPGGARHTEAVFGCRAIGGQGEADTLLFAGIGGSHSIQRAPPDIVGRRAELPKYSSCAFTSKVV